MAQIGFNDVSILGADGLQFILQGIISTKVTDTAPAAGTRIYTETVKGEVVDLTGEITQSNNNFYATGTMTFSGKANLVWVPK